MTLVRARREQRFVRACLSCRNLNNTLVDQVIHTRLYWSLSERNSVAMDRQEYPTVAVRLSALRGPASCRRAARGQEALRKG